MTWVAPETPPAAQSSQIEIIPFVAKKSDTVVGFAELVRYPENCDASAGYWLIGLKVRFLHRGSGIGEKLVRAVLERARELHARKVRVFVNNGNLPAFELYRKLGFEAGDVTELQSSSGDKEQDSVPKLVLLQKPLVSEQATHDNPGEAHGRAGQA